MWSGWDTAKGRRACWSRPLFQIMGPSASKKRKRDDEGEDGRISFKLSALPENQLGPVLGEFSQPSSCYRRWWLEIKGYRQSTSPVSDPQPTLPSNAIAYRPQRTILLRKTRRSSRPSRRWSLLRPMISSFSLTPKRFPAPVARTPNQT